MTKRVWPCHRVILGSITVRFRRRLRGNSYSSTPDPTVCLRGVVLYSNHHIHTRGTVSSLSLTYLRHGLQGYHSYKIIRCTGDATFKHTHDSVANSQKLGLKRVRNFGLEESRPLARNRLETRPLTRSWVGESCLPKQTFEIGNQGRIFLVPTPLFEYKVDKS